MLPPHFLWNIITSRGKRYHEATYEHAMKNHTPSLRETPLFHVEIHTTLFCGVKQELTNQETECSSSR
jgi:hypothetical protein